MDAGLGLGQIIVEVRRRGFYDDRVEIAGGGTKMKRFEFFGCPVNIRNRETTRRGDVISEREHGRLYGTSSDGINGERLDRQKPLAERIVNALVSAGSELTVAELARRCELPERDVNQHMPVLCSEGFVVVRSEGRIAASELAQLAVAE